MKELITNVETAPLQKIVIVGNGAVENGNEPLRRAIATFEGYDKHVGLDEKYKTSNPDLSSYLAAFSFVARDTRYALLKFLSQNGTIESPEKEVIDFSVAGFNEFRNQIGKSFCAAQENREISLRDYSSVLRYLELENDEPFGVISTNWDELLFENKLFSKHFIALHGRATEPASLILPMESTIDDTIVDLFLQNRAFPADSKEMELINKAFRDRGVRQHHDYIHQIASRWLSNAKRIVLWGVAFNSYDAELISLIPKDTRDRSLFILNPDTRARDIAGALLAGNSKNRIDYDPVRREQIIKR